MKRQIILLLCILIFSCQNESKLQIESWEGPKGNWKSHEGTKTIYYLVSGYSGLESDYEAIENHVCQPERDSLLGKYRQYWLQYYRKSEKTNNANIRKNPKDFFRYSTEVDHIATYTFFVDSVVSREKFYLDPYPRETDSFKEYDLCK